MRSISVFLGLTILLGWCFPLSDFYLLLPAEMFIYPRKTITNIQYTSILALFRWVLPAIVVAIFMWRAGLSSRIRSGFGLTLVSTCVALYLFQFAGRWLASLVPGGGGLYAISSLLSYVMLPIKIALLVGVVQLFTNLMPQHEA